MFNALNLGDIMHEMTYRYGRMKSKRARRTGSSTKRGELCTICASASRWRLTRNAELDGQDPRQQGRKWEIWVNCY